MDLADIVQLSKELKEGGAYHIRRGFQLSDCDEREISNHLIEEAVELQAEMFRGTRETQLEEASDLICVLSHAIEFCGFTVEELMQKAKEKLDANFTYNENQVQGNGFNRSNRVDTVDVIDGFLADLGCSDVVFRHVFQPAFETPDGQTACVSTHLFNRSQLIEYLKYNSGKLFIHSITENGNRHHNYTIRAAVIESGCK
jgi:phosphoribosyl-ATP pyrophosphohydrolase